MSSRLPGVPITATITFLKSDGETPYHLTNDIEGAVVIVYVKPNRVIAQFSLNTIEGYDEADSISAAAGQMVVTVDGEKTKDLRETQLHAVAIAQRDDGGSNYKIGTKDGREYEFAYITNNPNPALPDLS